MPEHSTLTGSSLHEPKGADTAAVNTVYVSDGAGSGSWIDVNTILTVTNFTTGDVKATIKTTADSGWIMMNDGTIGDALSSGTTRANADVEDLFTLLWNNISNTYAAVSGGRGANAAADWAAHKTIAVPKSLGRALAAAGTGSGLTARSLGQTLGEESTVLVEANLASHTHTGTTGSENATHTHSGTTGTESQNHDHGYARQTFSAQAQTGGTLQVATGLETGTTGVQNQLHTHSITTGGQSVSHQHAFTTAATGSGTAHNTMQPTLFLNYMMKL